MPVYLETRTTSDAILTAENWLSGKTSKSARGQQSSRCITIGLVNNMPDGALESTERQFTSLLDAASGSTNVRLFLYSMTDICRKGRAASRVRTFYSGVESLWDTPLDGIIVTGREPLAANLVDEPYWASFEMLVEWAREHTHSAVWSCLAAHAAVLHCDGINRIKSHTKRCGIFDCSRSEDHFLTDGLGPLFRLPHSRWNGVSDVDLENSGYQVLSRSEVGADVFVKQHRSLFVFFQGHPEYDSNTLMLEYRRDVGRYLRGEMDVYPSLPRQYFDERTIDELEAFQNEAMLRPREELSAKLYGILAQVATEAPWRASAVQIYRNWIAYITAQKNLHLLEREGIVIRKWARSSMVPITVASSDQLSATSLDQEQPRRVANAR